MLSVVMEPRINEEVSASAHYARHLLPHPVFCNSLSFIAPQAFPRYPRCHLRSSPHRFLLSVLTCHPFLAFSFAYIAHLRHKDHAYLQDLAGPTGLNCPR